MNAREHTAMMKRRTNDLRCLVSGQLLELADNLERLGVDADTATLCATSMLLDEIH